ncbi:hypothetical protein ACFL4T_04595 [candidate division KSB1 bacterium]
MKKYFCIVILLILSNLIFSQSTILIQGAMNVEVELFVQKMENPEPISLNGYDFWKGNLAGKDVLISKTEIGPVNAAISTCIAIERYKPALIINQGTCGSIIENLHKKDIIIGKSYVDYSGSIAPNLDTGKGSDPLNWTPLFYRIGRTRFDKIDCDPYFLDQAKNVSYEHGMVVTGVIGSAFQLNKERDRLKWLNETYGMVCEDMETAVSAMIAKVYGIDFIGIRIVSDNVITNEPFESRLAVYCNEFVIDLLRILKLPSK